MPLRRKGTLARPAQGHKKCPFRGTVDSFSSVTTSYQIKAIELLQLHLEFVALPKSLMEGLQLKQQEVLN